MQSFNHNVKLVCSSLTQEIFNQSSLQLSLSQTLNVSKYKQFMYSTVLYTLMARYRVSLFALVCWCIHAAIAQDKMQLWLYSKGNVTPHEGIAFFNKWTRVCGRKVKKEQLCSYDCIITV